jgi:Cys-tRNA(Pro)/Cys-tRNA(Cys) deacylase
MAARTTPATVAARRAGVEFAVHEYEHDPRAPSFGMEAVQRLGVDEARVFKTLVVELGKGGLAVAVVPAAATLDLKAVAAALGEKTARMARPEAAERATGYVAGGISPVGQKRALPTVLDATARAQPTVFVSAGRRGLELELTPDALAALTGATVAPVARRG